MTVPQAIDEYIAASPSEVRPILEAIRTTVRKAAPAAEERISYRMPAFFLDGALVYFAAFRKHIGFYPPVSDASLQPFPASVMTARRRAIRTRSPGQGADER